MEKAGLKILGLALTLFTVFVWGVTFVSTKYLLTGFTALEILFFRILVAYVALWIMKPKPLVIKDIKKEFNFLMAGLLGIFIYQLLENLSLNYSNASNVSIIVSISPVFTALTAQIFLKQKSLTWNFLLGCFIAIIGVGLVSFNGVVELHLSPKGDILALGSCICWGFYSLFVSKINDYGYNQIQSTRRMFMYCLLCMIPVMIEERIRGTVSLNVTKFQNINYLLNLLFLGVVASACCFVFWNKACQLLGTVYTSLGIYLIPVVTIIFAFIFLGEHMSWMGIAGTVFAIAGVFISGMKIKKTSQQNKFTN